MTRRMTLLVLALMGVMVLVVTVAPPNRDPTHPRKRAQEASTPVPPEPQLSDPDAFDVTAKLSAAPGAKLKTIEAELGDRVQIVVEGREPDSVALGELRTE